jgi:hypothetical protein
MVHMITAKSALSTCYNLPSRTLLFVSAGLVRAEEVHKVTTQAATRLEHLQHERTWNIIRLEHRDEARDASNAPPNADGEPSRGSSSSSSYCYYSGGRSAMQRLDERHAAGWQSPSGGTAAATGGSHVQQPGVGASSQAWSVNEDLQYISALRQRESMQRTQSA